MLQGISNEIVIKADLATPIAESPVTLVDEKKSLEPSSPRGWA